MLDQVAVEAALGDGRGHLLQGRGRWRRGRVADGGRKRARRVPSPKSDRFCHESWERRAKRARRAQQQHNSSSHREPSISTMSDSTADANTPQESRGRENCEVEPPHRCSTTARRQRRAPDGACRRAEGGKRGVPPGAAEEHSARGRCRWPTRRSAKACVGEDIAVGGAVGAAQQLRQALIDGEWWHRAVKQPTARCASTRRTRRRCGGGTAARSTSRSGRRRRPTSRRCRRHAGGGPLLASAGPPEEPRTRAEPKKKRGRRTPRRRDLRGALRGGGGRSPRPRERFEEVTKENGLHGNKEFAAEIAEMLTRDGDENAYARTMQHLANVYQLDEDDAAGHHGVAPEGEPKADELHSGGHTFDETDGVSSASRIDFGGPIAVFPTRTHVPLPPFTLRRCSTVSIRLVEDEGRALAALHVAQHHLVDRSRRVPQRAQSTAPAATSTPSVPFASSAKSVSRATAASASPPATSPTRGLARAVLGVDGDRTAPTRRRPSLEGVRVVGRRRGSARRRSASAPPPPPPLSRRARRGRAARPVRGRPPAGSAAATAAARVGRRADGLEEASAEPKEARASSAKTDTTKCRRRP